MCHVIKTQNEGKLVQHNSIGGDGGEAVLTKALNIL